MPVGLGVGKVAAPDLGFLPLLTVQCRFLKPGRGSRARPRVKASSGQTAQLLPAGGPVSVSGRVSHPSKKVLWIAEFGVFSRAFLTRARIRKPQDVCPMRWFCRCVGGKRV